jgi:hypothetical protein
VFVTSTIGTIGVPPGSYLLSFDDLSSALHCYSHDLCVGSLRAEHSTLEHPRERTADAQDEFSGALPVRSWGFWKKIGRICSISAFGVEFSTAR